MTEGLKTLKDFLKKEGAWGKYLANCKKQNMGSDERSFRCVRVKTEKAASVLLKSNSFSWDRTPERHYYWENLFCKLRNLELNE